jgi:L-aminopeptidase/D-esterase-like protein
LTAPGAGPSWTPHGSITDVEGIRVGHHQRTGRGWQTGTTAIIVADGATPGVDVSGSGPGTRETDALSPENLVDTVYGVCLSGGSAYGLSAADGVMAYLERRGLGFPVGDDRSHVVPIVPAAVIFDLGRGGNFANRPDPRFGHRAATTARARQRRWGAVGAGTGARAGGLQGGVGTACLTVPLPQPMRSGAGGPQELSSLVTVGALAVVNAHGTAIDPANGLPWEHRDFGLRRPSTTDRRALRSLVSGASDSRLNTTIGVVATSAALTKAEAGKMAAVANDGLARAIRPAHSLVDGDTIFALATGRDELPTADAPERPRVMAVNGLLAAAAEAFALACTHAVLSATTLGDALAYRDVCPSAWRSATTRSNT